MDVTVNMPVNTPDGDGIILGRSPTGKVIVRLKERKDVPRGEKTRTFNGWQHEYALDDLRLPKAKAK